METHSELAVKIRQLEKKYDQRFKVVFNALQNLIRQEKAVQTIGFKIGSTR